MKKVVNIYIYIFHKFFLNELLTIDLRAKMELELRFKLDKILLRLNLTKGLIFVFFFF